MNALQKINFKQPKYMLPAVIFLPLLFFGYIVCDIIAFETEETKAGREMVETEEINTAMPEVNSSNSNIKGKYEAMLDGFGKVTDYSAATSVEKEEEVKMDFESAYSDNEKRRVDSLLDAQAEQGRRIQEMMEQQRREMQQQQRQGERNVRSSREAASDSRIRDKEQQQMDQLTRQIETIQKVARGEKVLTEEEKRKQEVERRLAEELKRVNDSIALANAPVAVTKAAASDEQYFNTVSDDSDNPKLIRARVDELVKVKDGSRLRIRLSEDIEIDGQLLRKGAYLYATVKGFSAQRVNAEVTSIMLGDEIKKVQLTVYDLDCMKGFYVPSSDFRDLTKELGAGAMNMNVNMNSNSGQQSLESVAMQTLQQAFQSTTSALGNQIRKNRARIKYNTEIYLVDESN